jgi:hypothetical protein
MGDGSGVSLPRVAEISHSINNQYYLLIICAYRLNVIPTDWPCAIPFLRLTTLFNASFFSSTSTVAIVLSHSGLKLPRSLLRRSDLKFVPRRMRDSTKRCTDGPAFWRVCSRTSSLMLVSMNPSNTKRSPEGSSLTRNIPGTGSPKSNDSTNLSAFRRGQTYSL